MILMRLLPGREISTDSPIWLVLLRLLLLLAIIFAVAHPVLNPAGKLSGTGPLTLVVDNSWAGAGSWRARRQTLETLIAQAGQEERPVILATTARSSRNQRLQLMTASAAAKKAATLLPQPWSTDRPGVISELETMLASESPGQIVWLGDGVGDPDTEKHIRTLAAYGALSLYEDRPGETRVILYPPKSRGETLDLSLSRLQAQGSGTYRILARDTAGELLDSIDISFDGSALTAGVSLGMPSELRNRLARLEVEGENTAASVLLMDESWARRPIGLALPPGETSPASGESAQPLLSPHYYLERALQPVGDVRVGSIQDLLGRPLAVLVLGGWQQAIRIS